jgi:hypothetical protein
MIKISGERATISISEKDLQPTNVFRISTIGSQQHEGDSFPKSQSHEKRERIWNIGARGDLDGRQMILGTRKSRVRISKGVVCPSREM